MYNPPKVNLDMSALELRMSDADEIQQLETMLADAASALAEIKKLLTVPRGLTVVEVFTGIKAAVDSPATTKAIEWKRENLNRLRKKAALQKRGTPTGRIRASEPEIQELPKPKRTPSGIHTYTKLNIGCEQAPKTAGFWRENQDVKMSGKHAVGTLPFPVKLKLETFHLDEFLTQLEKIERKAQVKRFKGWSTHRWDGSKNGSTEFNYKGWRWPAGYRTYIEGGLLPRRTFFKFIMGYDLPGLQYF